MPASDPRIAAAPLGPPPLLSSNGSNNSGTAAPAGLTGLACVPMRGPPGTPFVNPCATPATDPRPSNAALLVCPPCSQPLEPCAAPIVTLPCGNAIHRGCVPAAASVAKPDNPAYFDCPFSCCKLKYHLRPDAVAAGIDVTLSGVICRWKETQAPGWATRPATSSSSSSSKKRRRLSLTGVPCTCGASDSAAAAKTAEHAPKRCGSSGTLRRVLTSMLCPKACSSSSPSLATDPASTADANDDGMDVDAPETASLRSSSSTSSLGEPPHKVGCPRHLPALPPPVEPLDFDDFEDILECPLCCQLIHDPVTLYPCGHTACRGCILRTLDHHAAAPASGTDGDGGDGDGAAASARCFLCRGVLPGAYLTYHAHASNRLLQKFVWHNFPGQAWVRAQALAAESRALLDDVPIFLCSLALPGAPVHLHVFEPRYRLMMRRVTAPGAPRLFGMCMPDPKGLPGPAPFGTMMRVEKLQWLPDGRCLVEATGVHAFRVKATGSLDGYTTAKVEALSDSDFLKLDDPLPVLEPPSQLPSASPWCPFSRAASSSASSSGVPPPTPPKPRTVRDFVCGASRKLGVFLEQLPVTHRCQFVSQYGCMPCDPALFSYWLAGVLPVQPADRYKLLAMRSARDRLALVVQWVRAIKAATAARQQQQSAAAQEDRMDVDSGRGSSLASAGPPPPPPPPVPPKTDGTSPVPPPAQSNVAAADDDEFGSGACSIM
ncbi:hypothetical protein BC828DRAFT_387391 [Blastocladiella britannica]|nr:hypothetical protein BC828DRAFT_387391 [Blastocladiella britannica]